MKNKKTITLIEMVAVIVIFGMIVPPLLIALGHISTKVARAEQPSTAVLLARDLMEEIISKRFDETHTSACGTYPCSVPCSCWSNPLGYDSSTTGLDGTNFENATNHANWDDIDDYDGFSQTNIPGFPGFTRQVTVYYVNPDGSTLDTTQSDASRTNYKRVDVRVSSSKVGNVYFSFILSAEY